MPDWVLWALVMNRRLEIGETPPAGSPAGEQNGTFT